MRRALLFLALTVASLVGAAAVSPQPAQALTPPSAFVNAWAWGRYYWFADWTARWGYTVTGWAANCGNSSYNTPNLYPCTWSGDYLVPGDPSAHNQNLSNSPVKNYVGYGASGIDPDGYYQPWNPPVGGRAGGWNGTGLWAVILGDYKYTVGTGTVFYAECDDWPDAHGGYPPTSPCIYY